MRFWDKWVNWYIRQRYGMRAVSASVANAVAFYFAAFLGASVSHIAESKGQDAFLVKALHAGVWILIIALVALVSRTLSARDEATRARQQARIAMRLHAYVHLDRLVSEETHAVSAMPRNGAHFLERMIVSVEALQSLVRSTFSAFEANYGTAPGTDERVDFEVTFMTESYADGQITIPAYANRDGRAPRSMVLRSDQPDIYKNSITASIYSQPRPSLRIIEDTGDPSAGYQELYPEQKSRIRSSIVFPVLSDANRLLGCLVVHCDRPKFFLRSEEKYWSDVLETFAKRIALAKVKLDRIVEFGKAGVLCDVRCSEPPF